MRWPVAALYATGCVLGWAALWLALGDPAKALYELVGIAAALQVLATAPMLWLYATERLLERRARRKYLGAGNRALLERVERLERTQARHREDCLRQSNTESPTGIAAYHLNWSSPQASTQKHG